MLFVPLPRRLCSFVVNRSFDPVNSSLFAYQVIDRTKYHNLRKGKVTFNEKATGKTYFLNSICRFIHCSAVFLIHILSRTVNMSIFCIKISRFSSVEKEDIFWCLLRGLNFNLLISLPYKAFPILHFLSVSCLVCCGRLFPLSLLNIIFPSPCW